MRLMRSIFAALFLAQVSQAAIIRGNPEGNIELIEVIDYQCPYCESDEPIVDEFLSRHSKVKLRLMPVAVINPTSIKEATAIFVSTNFAGKFESLHQQFLSKKLSDEAVDETLKESGMDDSVTLKAMHDPTLQSFLQEGQILLEKNSSGTPLFLISKAGSHSQKVLSGYQSLSALEKSLNEISEPKESSS